MTAKKSDSSNAGKRKFSLDARPPQRLSRDDKDLLQSLKPSKIMRDRAVKMVRLPTVDGATCGL